MTGLLGHVAGPRQSDRFQLNDEVSDCWIASVPVIGLDGLDKSLSYKSKSFSETCRCYLIWGEVFESQEIRPLLVRNKFYI